MKNIFLIALCFTGLVACSKSDDGKKASVALAAEPQQANFNNLEFCNQGNCLTKDDLRNIKSLANREYERYSRRRQNMFKNESDKSAILAFAYKEIKGVDFIARDEHDGNVWVKLYNYVYGKQISQPRPQPRRIPRR